MRLQIGISVDWYKTGSDLLEILKAVTKKFKILI